MGRYLLSENPAIKNIDCYSSSAFNSPLKSRIGLRYTLTERDKLSLSVISRQWRSIEILRLAIIIFSVKLTDDTFKYKQVGPWPFEVTRRHSILEADFSTL